jgi:hypothetical protein
VASPDHLETELAAEWKALIAQASILSFSFQESWGAPYLARFLRDVGYHSTLRAPFEGRKKDKVRGIPHLQKKSEIWGTARFLEGRKVPHRPQ